MATYKYSLYKPTQPDGLLKDLSIGYNLTLAQLDTVQIIAGLVNDIPQRWGLIRANIGLDCDANAGDRYIYLLTYTKDRLTQSGIASHKFIANDANSWTLGEAVLESASTLAQGSYTGLGKDGIVIEGNQYIEIWVSGAKVGDVWHVIPTLKYLGEGVAQEKN